MKKYQWKVGVFLFVAFFCSMVLAAEQNPVDLLQSIANQMISSLQKNKATLKTNPSLVYKLADHLIVPHADLNEMSMRVLPPKVWGSATPTQRSQFQKQFTIILERTYGSALAEYKNETVNFYPVRGGFAGKNEVQVDSDIIRSDGPTIRVSYRLVYRGSEWKLYDMIVEGISMLESFRSQFADKLANGNMNDLIRELVKHNAGHAG